MKKQKEPMWLMIIRIVLACVFIFSGLTKMVDPVASGIKMYEYFISFGMEFMHPFSLTLGILMNIAEFTLGFMLLFKIRVNLTALGYLLFMGFFFFLTAWLAVAEHLEVHYGYQFNVVRDCGCFGQAVAMSNLETFLKNVVLMILTLIVFAKRKTIPDIKLTLLGQWLLAVVGAVIALLIQMYCLRNLPVIDFSNWKKGKDVTELFIEKPAEINVLFLYKNDKGEEKLLSMEDMDNITETHPNFYNDFFYVDRIDSVISEAVHAEIQGFSMLDEQGRDWASIYLNKNREHVYILFMHDLDEVNDKAMKSEALQNLIVYSEENNIDFVGITNSSPDEIAAFIEKYNIIFPIYYNPIDPIKGPFMVRDAVRSNPGLVILKNGVVVDKKAWRKF
ncbi:MAG: DoxX family protein [Bacteroidetes bacterium]|nr:DoxX family protein [Bacteroidota bacterium]MCL2303419.1 DoxX family protein [Lentimicrobiaceae bacterium]